ncbi:calmodulin-dependent protein kinase [Gigaspora margarita]|uniref:Calmodulin-dependent protein kinase n=1 Tax=Gigaspora margarita TaxID=4874 RepID=A0A8H4B4X3_GIGMA|nr:calmodulin-dependent protein kinase [Gigaspora margarita]
MSSIDNQNHNNTNNRNEANINIDVTSTEAFSACLDQIFALAQDPMVDIVDNLYKEIYDLYNQGIESIPEIINNFLDKNYKSAIDVFKWLLFYKKDKSEYICLLGIFYHWNIGTDGTKGNEFKLFQDAASAGDGGNHFAEYFVGKCYEEGVNTKKKKTKAIEWFTKASKGCTAAEYSLGAYYYKKQKYYLSVTWLQKAAKKDNVKALHLLGLCYLKGRGVHINALKAFELFTQAVEKDSPEAQYELGQCYEFGIGTAKDLGKASELFKKASSKGINCYRDLDRVRAKIMRKI